MAGRKLEGLEVKAINEVLSWNKLITAAKEIDKNRILQMLKRFQVGIRK